MIGVLQQAVGLSVGGGEPPALEVFITPSRGSYTSSNGSYTTPVFTANVSGGTEPYSYLWEAIEGNAEILSPTDAKTRVRISGYNNIEVYAIRCTITDDAANVVSAEAAGVINFGTTEGLQP